MSDDENKRQQVDLLLEEWKKNVDLYIDQDKRGFDRIRMFLTIHAGLIVLYGFLIKETRDLWAVLAIWVVVAVGSLFTLVTELMSVRAHAFILLRRIQGILIEKKLNHLINTKEACHTSSDIVTTFMREHAAFRNNRNWLVKCLHQVALFPFEKSTQQSLTADEEKLLSEVNDSLGSYASDTLRLENNWAWSISHFDWLKLVYRLLYLFWILLGVLGTVAYVWDC